MKQVVLHLSLIDGVGPSTISQIIDGLPVGVSVSDLYQFRISDFVQYCRLSTGKAAKIVAGLADNSRCQKELDLMARHTIGYVTCIDEQYPPLLKEINLPPTVLYYRGSLDLLHAQSIAFVGARKANQYGKQVVDQLVPPLVARDWVIVSGGAYGIDTMAHLAAIEARGKTVVVLGSGLLNMYPYTNKRLFDQVVAAGGTLISAFPLHTEPLPGNFPARNRIIAGLSQGCVVVQAAVKSGARITAQFALESGREVFAVPGPIHDPLSRGCHALLQEGAQLVASVDDIIGLSGKNQVHTSVSYSRKELERAQEARVAVPVDSKEGKIMTLLSTTSCSTDDLLIKTELSLLDLNMKLFDLQIAGMISQNAIGHWERL